MDLDKIRNMNDEDLRIFLKSLGNRKANECIKCGKAHANFAVYIQNKERFQQKKLCSLCDECYSELLNNLKVSDIMWD